MSGIPNRYHFINTKEQDIIVNLDLVHYVIHGRSSRPKVKFSIVFYFGADQRVIQYCRSDEEYADILAKLRGLNVIS